MNGTYRYTERVRCIIPETHTAKTRARECTWKIGRRGQAKLGSPIYHKESHSPVL